MIHHIDLVERQLTPNPAIHRTLRMKPRKAGDLER